MMRIAAVHQGYELYGSDRAFIDTVKMIRAAWPGATIDVVVPRDGPIVAPLAEVASRVVVEDLWVLRKRSLGKLATLGVLTFVPALARAIRRFRAYDLVYVNTTVVLDHLVAARLFRGKALVHVHELPEGKILAGLRALVLFSRARVLFNAKATRDAFSLPDSVPQRVVYNSVPAPSQEAGTGSGYDGSRPLRLLQIGRLSTLKGQEVLIRAVAALPEALRRRLDVRIVGEAFENPAFADKLKVQVAQAGLSSIVNFQPFTADPAEHYMWADCVVVPSQQPESLGRVAIEAMSYGRPPIVSSIGGLKEIVVDGETGWWVPPGDSDALARRITEVAEAPGSWADMPARCHARYASLFSEAAVGAQIQRVFRDALPSDGRGSSAEVSAVRSRT